MSLRLGAGGMGEVYQAYDQRLDRWVAVKLIRAPRRRSTLPDIVRLRFRYISRR